NIWLVWPQFGKVTFWENKRDTAEKNLNKFNSEIQRRSVYEQGLKKLSALGGVVAPDEQAISLYKDVLSYAALTGVGIDSSSQPQRGYSGGRTNATFEEQTMQIAVKTGERELVDFLYNLGTRNSMIRVRTMNLQPDPTRLRLQGQIALVASYQKKPPPRTIATATGTNRPAAATKPTAPVGKTNAPTNASPRSGTTAAPRPGQTTTVKPPPPTTSVAANNKTNVAGKK